MIEEANTNRTGGYDNLDMIEYIVSLIENKVGDLLLAEFFHWDSRISVLDKCVQI